MWKYIKQLKNAKTFVKFKEIAGSILKQLGLRQKLNPKSFENPNIKHPSKIYPLRTEQGTRLTQKFTSENVLYYDKKICDGLNITITEFFDTETFRNLEQEIE